MRLRCTRLGDFGLLLLASSSSSFLLPMSYFFDTLLFAVWFALRCVALRFAAGVPSSGIYHHCSMFLFLYLVSIDGHLG